MKSILTNDNFYIELDENKITINYDNLIFSKDIELSELGFCKSYKDIEENIYELIDSNNFHISNSINSETEYINIELYIYIGNNRIDYILEIPQIKKKEYLYTELLGVYELLCSELVRLINNTRFYGRIKGNDLYKNKLLMWLEQDDIKSFVKWYNQLINEKIECYLYDNNDNKLSDIEKYKLFYIISKIAESKNEKIIIAGL
jgi:hypothetical protein